MTGDGPEPASGGGATPVPSGGGAELAPSGGGARPAPSGGGAEPAPSRGGGATPAPSGGMPAEAGAEFGQIGESAAPRLARYLTRVASLLEREPMWVLEFTDLRFEWRRLFSEVFGTFLLVLAAAGAVVVDSDSHGQVGRSAAVVAPALTVLAVILFMGAVSGAHLNPVVTIAFALRRDFGWRRVPGYVVAQFAGAIAASALLRAAFGTPGHLGATLPGPGFSTGQAFLIESVLTVGLVSTILGTASTAQNVGALSAFGVAGYIALAGLWASPVSGASMNPARSLGPALVGADFTDVWIYLTAPPLGAVLAVAGAYVLRGPGGDPGGVRAAQGSAPRTPKPSS